jgi:hypothetical protein
MKSEKIQIIKIMKFILLLSMFLLNKAYSQRNKYLNSWYFEYGYTNILSNKFLITELTDKSVYKEGKSFKIGYFANDLSTNKHSFLHFFAGISFSYSNLETDNVYLLSNVQKRYTNYDWTSVNYSKFQGCQLNVELGFSIKFKNFIFYDFSIGMPNLGCYWTNDLIIKGTSDSGNSKIRVESSYFVSLLYKHGVMEFLSFNNNIRLKFHRIGFIASFKPMFLLAKRDITIDYKFPDKEWQSNNKVDINTSLYSVNLGITYNF